jgi:hypothetical protein
VDPGKLRYPAVRAVSASVRDGVYITNRGLQPENTTGKCNLWARAESQHFSTVEYEMTLPEKWKANP